MGMLSIHPSAAPNKAWHFQLILRFDRSLKKLHSESVDPNRNASLTDIFIKVSLQPETILEFLPDDNYCSDDNNDDDDGDDNEHHVVAIIY